MDTGLQKFTDQLRPFLASNVEDKQTLKLDFKGYGFIHIAGAIVTNDDAPADCTIIVSLDDLERISKGDLDPAEAFQQGRLRIDGDIGVAMKLQPFFSNAWA
jgi:putative sterol carrier protein